MTALLIVWMIIALITYTAAVIEHNLFDNFIMPASDWVMISLACVLLGPFVYPVVCKIDAKARMKK